MKRQAKRKHGAPQVRSNEELQAALLEEPGDKDFMDAISENKVRRHSGPVKNRLTHATLFLQVVIERCQTTLHNIDIALERVARVADVGYFTPLAFASPHMRNGTTAADHRQAEIQAAEAARQAKSRERMKALRTSSRHSSDRRSTPALPPVPRSQQSDDSSMQPPLTPDSQAADEMTAGQGGVGAVDADGSMML